MADLHRTIRDERIKLLAHGLSRCGGWMIGVAFAAPAVALLYDRPMPWGAALALVAAGLALHFAGYRLLERLGWP